jgi:hypothetical protein
VAATLAGKLEMKPGQTLAVEHAPQGLTLEVPLAAAGDSGESDALLVFVVRGEDVEERAAPVVQTALRDGLAWMAYPKAGKLGTDLNRDRLRELMAARGVNAVRQVAIDDTWSALRFRAPRG